MESIRERLRRVGVYFGFAGDARPAPVTRTPKLLLAVLSAGAGLGFALITWVLDGGSLGPKAAGGASFGALWFVGTWLNERR